MAARCVAARCVVLRCVALRGVAARGVASAATRTIWYMTLRCVAFHWSADRRGIFAYSQVLRMRQNSLQHGGQTMVMVATAYFVAVHRHLQRRNVRRIWMLPII